VQDLKVIRRGHLMTSSNEAFFYVKSSFDLFIYLFFKDEMK